MLVIGYKDKEVGCKTEYSINPPHTLLKGDTYREKELEGYTARIS